jgi:hypothetical protein
MKEPIIELGGITVWFHTERKVIHHEMSKYPGTESLEKALEAGLDVLRARGVKKWLSDDRKGGALPKSHHDWGQNVFGPAAARAGWKYWALCPPSEMLGSANMRRLAEIYASLGVEVRTFATPEAALAWLDSLA